MLPSGFDAHSGCLKQTLEQQLLTLQHVQSKLVEEELKIKNSAHQAVHCQPKQQKCKVHRMTGPQHTINWPHGTARALLWHE